MRKFAAVLFLLLCFASLLNAQKTRLGQKSPQKPTLADYTVKLHISASHIRDNCTGVQDQITCANWLYIDAILNGKKLEFIGTTALVKHTPVLLIPGDYPARLTNDFQNADSALIYQEYDVLLPDGSIWHCVSTGISE